MRIDVRRGSGLVVAAVLLAASAACGGSSSSSGAQGAATPSNSPTSEQPLTVAQAKQIAAAINLTPTDMPGYTSKKDVTTPNDRASDAKVAKCAGSTPPSKALVDQSSPDFDKGSGLSTQEVSSDVTVLPTSQDVATDLSAVKSQRALSCFKKFFDQMLKQQANGQATVSGLSISATQPGVGDPATTFGFRVTGKVGAGTTTIPFYVDAFGFAHGRAEVELTSFTLSQPVSQSDVQRLETLLVTRAQRTAS